MSPAKSQNRSQSRRDATPDRQSQIDDLCAAFSALEGAGEGLAFLRDLTTPGELAALAERWRIARLLDDGALSYREIAAQLGASTTTVARVARFLHDEQHGGYRLMLDRLHPKSAR